HSRELRALAIRAEHARAGRSAVHPQHREQDSMHSKLWRLAPASAAPLLLLGHASAQGSAFSTPGMPTQNYAQGNPTSTDSSQAKGLGGQATIRAGRFFMDFGKQMQTHVHELRTIERPLVFRAYLGEEVKGDGVQWDSWTSVGDKTALRWSLGVFNNLLREPD